MMKLGLTWLLGGFRWAIGLFTRYPWQAICCATLLLAAQQFHARGQAEASRDALSTKLKNERADRAAERAMVAGAQAAAAALAAKERAAAEARYQSLAERTDYHAQAALDAARTRADVFARAHSLHTEAPGSASRPAAATAQSDSTKGADRSSADAVVLSREDFDVMVENSVRLKAAHEWALGLELQPE